MKNNFLLKLSLSFLLFFLVGCNNNRIIVDSAEPVVRHISSQVLDIRNCGSRSELIKSLATEFQVALHVTINNETPSTENVKELFQQISANNWKSNQSNI